MLKQVLLIIHKSWVSYLIRVWHAYKIIGTEYLQEGEMNDNWFEVSTKVGLSDLLNRFHNFWARLGNKDRQIKMGSSMTHFLNSWVNTLYAASVIFLSFW